MSAQTPLIRAAWDFQAITGPRPTGLGVSVRLLLDALQSEQPEVEVVGLRPNEHNQPLRSVADRLRWEQWQLPRSLAAQRRRGRIDLLYSPALGAPLRSSVPRLAHVHDLIALRFPQQFSGVSGWYWKKLLPYSWKRCPALTVSNASVAAELSELLQYPPQSIHVVPYYPDPQLARLAAGQDLEHSGAPREPQSAEPIFVTLGSHEPRKNIELAIEALSLLRGAGLRARLRCIGMHSDHTASLKALATRLAISDAVDFPDFLDRAGIVASLREATALIFVSRYEGYGMPPQEAQSLGCPVILSDIACHRAVYDDASRWQQLPPEQRMTPPFVDVADSAALAAHMRRMAEDAAWRGALSAAGRLYSATFTPQDTALALRQAFVSLLA